MQASCESEADDSAEGDGRAQMMTGQSWSWLWKYFNTRGIGPVISGSENQFSEILELIDSFNWLFSIWAIPVTQTIMSAIKFNK